ncbi:MAG: amidohydrolase family protein [Actinomycetes bacterium]|nr:amidohydrolase family protein [Actinomycetes bacterium]
MRLTATAAQTTHNAGKREVTMNGYKVIDTHVHVFPDKVEGAAIQALSVPERVNKIGGTLQAALERMDRLGIESGWTVPVATKASQVASINDYAATQPRERFVPFGAIHPDCDDVRAVLATFRERGLPGFKMHPDYQDCRPTDPRMTAIYDAAVDFDLIGYFHAGDDVGPRTRYGSPEEFAAVIDEYPRMRLVLAHLGGYRMWDQVEELIVGHGLPGYVYLDTAYTVTEMPREQLLRIIHGHGTRRILFGTDSPWTHPEEDFDFFIHSDLEESDLEAIFHGNAERLLADVGYNGKV